MGLKNFHQSIVNVLGVCLWMVRYIGSVAGAYVNVILIIMKVNILIIRWFKHRCKARVNESLRNWFF